MLSHLSKLRRRLFYFREWLADANAYLRHSTVLGYVPGHLPVQKESELIRFCHSLEKCLCMQEFRPRSGSHAVRALATLLEEHDASGNPDDEQIRAARTVLNAYRSKHEQLGIDITDFGVTWPCEDPAGSPLQTFREWQAVTGEDAEAFERVVLSRKSLRNFEDGRIPERTDIEHAVEMAIRTPSVCNRQTWRVHAYTGERVAELLELQSGNRGFGHNIPLLLVVSSDMRYFTGSQERYQPWIEGGLFSMTLLLALHAKGLAAVPLNWSVNNDRDRKMHAASEIPGHERIIMLIGCGYPKAGSLAPISARRSVGDTITFHD